ncbi:unnamed protein product [Rhizophagus irregularis]|uniref:Uncharacterized protein n=1 Tax=Rhizophagus irregularis TaxID=588596 RepID=A0A915YXB6_9GLOM|nr:unnamed protein product [Rhizophagus irregularis]
MKVTVIGYKKSEVQTSKTVEAHKVLEQIEEAVRGKQDQVVVKLQFPDNKLNSLNMRNAIHSYYKAEIINYELLIIQERVTSLKSLCLPPDIWIENTLGIGIAIPHTYNTFQLNPFSGAPLMSAIMTGQNRRPQLAPYLIHWDITYTPHYYIINWNLHLRLRCGAIIDFNIIFDVLSR